MPVFKSSMVNSVASALTEWASICPVRKNLGNSIVMRVSTNIA